MIVFTIFKFLIALKPCKIFQEQLKVKESNKKGDVKEREKEKLVKILNW